MQLERRRWLDCGQHTSGWIIHFPRSSPDLLICCRLISKTCCPFRRRRAPVASLQRSVCTSTDHLLIANVFSLHFVLWHVLSTGNFFAPRTVCFICRCPFACVGRASVGLHTEMYFANNPTEEDAFVLSVEKTKLSVIVPRFGIEGTVRGSKVVKGASPQKSSGCRKICKVIL